MELSDEGTEPAQLGGRERLKSAGHLPRDVLQDVAAELVAPQRAGGTLKAGGGEVVKQRLDGRSGITRRLAHGRTDPDHHVSDIAALKDVLRG
jgi:hypothetical protein